MNAVSPWHLSRTRRYVMDGPGSPWVCEVTDRPGWEDHARLIVTAPVMLDALRAVDRQVFCDCPGMDDCAAHQPGCFVPLVRAAIAKASPSQQTEKVG